MVLPTSSTAKALLHAQLELWNVSFAFVRSMALKSAVELGVADAIELHDSHEAKVHPSKIPCLGRLMRALTAAGVFGVQTPSGGGSDDPPLYYTLTPTSSLLVGLSPQSQAPITAMT
ncbi:hypothetical protein EJB05_31123, partial [Eragrostis curvula]